MYVKGSSKNLSIGYRNGQPNLRMPQVYLSANEGVYGTMEGQVSFPDVFPQRLGEVTGVDVDNPLVFTESTMDFDLNAVDGDGNTTVLIPNVTAKVVFQTGQLAGYTLDIQDGGYDTGTKTFTLIPNQQEEAWDIPSDLVRPQVGDTYILEGIQMPQVYVTNAEAELHDKGQAYLQEHCNPQYLYKGKSDPLHFGREGLDLVLGSKVYLDSDEFDLGRQYRIISLTRDINVPLQMDIEFGTTRQMFLNLSNMLQGVNLWAQINQNMHSILSVRASLNNNNFTINSVKGQVTDIPVPDWGGDFLKEVNF